MKAVFVAPHNVTSDGVKGFCSLINKVLLDFSSTVLYFFLSKEFISATEVLQAKHGIIDEEEKAMFCTVTPA